MPRRIVILDDDEDLRALLKELYEDDGGDCLTAGSVPELCGYEQRVLCASLVVLDVNLGPDRPSGVDAYDWLLRRSFGGRVVFLTGHAASHPLVREASRRGATILQKPVAATDLLALAHESAPQPRPGE